MLRTYQDGLLAINSRTNQPPTKEQLNLRPNTRLLRPETQEDFVAAKTIGSPEQVPGDVVKTDFAKSLDSDITTESDNA